MKLIMEKSVWVYRDYYCHCGCGERIFYREYQKKQGIPRYRPSHYSKTEEHREQARESLTGENNPYYESEARLEQSKRQMGSGNTFYGRHHTKKSRLKISIACRKVK